MAGGKREDENRPDSTLYRLWLSSKLKKQKSEEPNPEDIPNEAEQEPAAAPAEDSPEELPAGQDYMEALWRKVDSRAENEEYNPLRFVELQPEEGFSDYREELLGFLKGQQLTAESLYLRLRQNDLSFTDAQARVVVSKDRLRAWFFIYPAFGSGREITAEKLREALLAAGVVFGLNEAAIGQAVADRKYFVLIDAAKGTPSFNGTDGKLVECLSQDASVHQAEDESGLTEFSRIIAFRNVLVGTVIFKVTPPTEGSDGIDVRGAKRNGITGKHVRPPHIPNTALSEDGTTIVSTVNGAVSFVDGQFIVEKLMVVNENVDAAFGDLEFDGDIQINGDVCEGRRVTATGNITIRGMAENSFISAGRDILITKGMNGNQEGELKAGGSVTSKYLENCSVQARGLIQANSIICSDVVGDDEIRVVGGKGVIIGGSCTAFHKITASGIGAKSNRPTLVVLGTTPHLLQRRMELETALQAAREELSHIEKNMRYLRSIDPQIISEERKKLEAHLRLQKPLVMLRIKKLTAELAETNMQKEDLSQFHISCSALYPATRIMIGSAVLNVEEEHHTCNIYYSKEEAKIVIGVP